MSPQYPEIYVIRHGQTEWNLEGRLQGRLDSALTAKGRAQARAMGRLMQRELSGRKDVTAFTSPQGRARATARLVCEPTGLVPVADDRIREIGFGEWEGLANDDLHARWPDRAALAETEPFLWHFQAPGGENLAEMQKRALAFLEDLTGVSVIVTHGVLSRVLRALWLGLNEYQMQTLPGGQGVIFHLSQTRGHRQLGK